MFEIKNLTFKNILNISLLTIDNPITCITGPSGSGKTTLLRMLNRLDVPDTGEILYNGVTLSEIPPVELRRQVTMLAQSPIIYDGTIEENLQIGLKFSQRQLASLTTMEKILEDIGIKHSPKEYCDKLSGGEKQRLCLARVLLMDSETYLMDEPSSALDKETETFIIEYLANLTLKRNKQLILITHSPEVISKFSGSVIRLAAGNTNGYETGGEKNE